MQLTLQDVAHLFGVTESTVNHWIQQEHFPVEIVNSRYRCNRCELLEWATARKIQISPAAFQEVNGGAVDASSVADALQFGGVTRLSPSDSTDGIQSIFERALDQMPLPPRFDRNMLVQLLVARESAGSTAWGDGIAIPHPRYPVILALPRPAIRLCYLSKPLDLAAPDGKPIDTLFIMLCPTVHEHLQLLARLAVVVRDDAFRQAMKRSDSVDEVLRHTRRVEESLPQAVTA